ncbi:hypothetical protein ACNF42_04225 [Cuniculiplasma sp. SKW3]|uniref:hypothetical protein n=1 Tax=Cuniculiplasma sp. SKW3 TaxID=3400170 RepID=UPI003FD01241
MSNHTVIFLGNSTHNLCISTNITIFNEILESNCGPVQISNTVTGINVAIVDSIFEFSGSFYLHNMSLNMENSKLLGGHIRTEFSFVHGLIINSTLNTTSAIEIGGQRYLTGQVCKNGQPAGGYLPVKFTLKRETFSEFPIDIILMSINYTATLNENISISMSPSNSLNLKENFTLERNQSFEKVRFLLKKPLYIGRIQNNSSFWGYINASQPQNITIWGAKLALYSTSVLNYTGITHNFIMVSQSKLIVVNSIIKGKSGNFENDGIPNCSKTGLIGTNNSSILMINPTFLDWTGDLNLSNSPVVLEKGSTLKMFTSIILRGDMHNLTEIVNLSNLTIFGNNGVKVELPEKYYSYGANGRISAYVMVLNMSNNFEIFNNFNVFIFNRSYSFSINSSKIMAIHEFVFNISLNFTSQIYSSISVEYNNTTVNTHFMEESFYNVSQNVSLSYGITYGENRTFDEDYYNKMETGLMNTQSETLQRESSFNWTELYAYIVIEYFNGLKTIQVQKSLTLQVPPHYFNYSLEESGLPSNSTWGIVVNNRMYQTSTTYLRIGLLKPKEVVRVENTSLYHPESAEFCMEHGKLDIQFARTYGYVNIIILSSVNNYHITYDNLTFEFKEDNITLRIPYGITSLTIKDRYGIKEINVSLYTKCEKVIVSMPGPKIDYLPMMVETGVIIAISSTAYFIIRREFYSFCPYCMELVKPFGIYRHHCKYGQDIKQIKKDKSSRR